MYSPYLDYAAKAAEPKKVRLNQHSFLSHCSFSYVPFLCSVFRACCAALTAGALSIGQRSQLQDLLTMIEDLVGKIWRQSHLGIRIFFVNLSLSLRT
eukprot:g48334.t1